VPRLAHITTVPQSLGFVAGQVDFLIDRGWDVHVISSPGRMLDDFARRHSVAAHGVSMERAITPRRDLGAVARLTDLLFDVAADVVHAHTPKGGLLGMVSAQAALVPVRVYQMRGLLTATARGPRKLLYAAAERTSCTLAHHVVCQSPSLRTYAIDTHLVSGAKSSVLANGSNGVDAEERFNPATVTGLDVRHQLGIDGDACVIGFVGRIVRDKGIAELVDAWRVVKGHTLDVHLLMVGPFETRDGISGRLQRALRDDPRVHLVGFVRDTPRYYEAMDVLVHPSHREGFPNVPLEAAAMGVPTVTTNAIGCVDAVVDGVTGLRVEVGDAVGLSRAILSYLDNPELRAEHGAAARARVMSDFRPEDIHRASLALYQRLLSA
jgi:glycosyltransferase involved in cell wall biosynthesis